MKHLSSANEKLAVKLTIWFGSMAMFWLCVALCAAPVIPSMAPYKDSIFYISSGVIQLIALPLILVGGRILSASSDRQAREMHDAVISELAEIKEMHAELKELVKANG